MSQFLPRKTSGASVGLWLSWALVPRPLKRSAKPKGARADTATAGETMGEIMEKPSENGDLRKKMVGFDGDLQIYG